ncbi:TRAP transporter substrate-binding protein [Nocardioides panaciterrulae]|uniref:Tripartite ATP-independent transporter DctP family solute receptor n=1 Tax=Nocardioides panaciterrulae TaxID=661492 RepID=A0A7Y9E8Z9_9ACTN|nr:TRAP transporter substrate-binding protein [Nocardioides panaciterrulae]NYD43444.1 tripartite ATP-independent transporter DctP family solute receptor [Nocardioides panaciterrulae]
MVDRSTSRRSFLKFGSGAALAVAGAPLLAACGAGASSSGAGGVTLKMSSSMSGQPGNAHSAWFGRFQQALKKNVGDAVTVDYFPDSQLGDEAKMVQQLRMGAADMMISGSSIWSQVAPDFGVLDMGYLFDSWDQVGSALDSGAGTTLATTLQDKAGVKTLGWAFNFGARNMLTKPQVTSPADLQQLKIRTLQAPEVIQTVNLMGAVATPLATTEVYTSLQTGLIDGLGHDAPTILQNKWDELAKHLALTEHIFNPLIVVVGQSSYNKIPSQHRQGFMDAARQATEYQRGQAVAAEEQAMSQLKSKGVTVTTVDKSAFQQRVKPLWQKFVSEHPSAQPVLDAITKLA